MAIRHTARGWWQEEAGARPAPAARRRRRRPTWRSWAADTRACGPHGSSPSSSPRRGWSLVEAERCGAGPSGRNGGFVNEMWFSLPALRRRFGDAAALRGRTCRTGGGRGGRPLVRGAAAWTPGTAPGGYLQVSTAPAYDGTWQAVADACAELGRPGGLPAADRGRGAGSLRLAALSRRGLLSRRRHRPAGEAGARASVARLLERGRDRSSRARGPAAPPRRASGVDAAPIAGAFAPAPSCWRPVRRWPATGRCAGG